MSTARARAMPSAQQPESRAWAKLDHIVFAHDYAFLQGPNGQVFSDRGDWTWHRYLDFAREVTVASRTRPLPADRSLNELTLVSPPGVMYESIPSLSGPVLRFANRREAERGLRAAIGSADALVARLPSEIGSLAIEVANRMHKPWAVEVVTCTWDALWNYGSWQGKVYAPYSWWRTRRLVRRAPYAMYETQQFLQGRYPAGGKMVGCPIAELPEVEPSVLARRLDAIADWKPPLRIGLIGALSVGFKGIDTALEALRRVRERLPAFEFRVLGAGDPERWRRLAVDAGLEQQVYFDGVVPSGEPVDRWLDSIDVYIQPSFQEGLPRGTLEAMRRGCPTLGSTAGGLPELLGPDSMHRPGDAERLGELIAGTGLDREWQANQARRNFELAKRYSKPVLDERRREFWGEFAAWVRKGR
jgi:glycosyltransferase involved in cell wall biosynthesis